MEKTSRAMLYPAKFGWIDFDDWSTLYKGTPLKDNNGNHIVLPKDNVDNDLDMLVNNKGSIIIEKNKGKLLVIKGLKDFIVIDTDDVLLICPRVENPLKELMSKLAMPRYDKFR
jgi:mannose-1-phosphate guanylyltransferase